jgi:hypothetical protein
MEVTVILFDKGLMLHHMPTESRVDNSTFSTVTCPQTKT